MKTIQSAKTPGRYPRFKRANVRRDVQPDMTPPDDGPWPKPLTHAQYLSECDAQERHPTYMTGAWYDDELTLAEAVDWRDAGRLLGMSHPLDVQQTLHRWRVPVRVWIGEYDGLTTYYSRRAVLQLAELLRLRRAAKGKAATP